MHATKTHKIYMREQVCELVYIRAHIHLWLINYISSKVLINLAVCTMLEFVVAGTPIECPEPATPSPCRIELGA